MIFYFLKILLKLSQEHLPNSKRCLMDSQQEYVSNLFLSKLYGLMQQLVAKNVSLVLDRLSKF